MGTTFVAISAIISFYINKIKRKILLSKFVVCITFYSYLLFDSHQVCQGQSRSRAYVHNYYIFSNLVNHISNCLRINSFYWVFLHYGDLFYDIFECRTMRWHHKRNISWIISNKLSSNGHMFDFNVWPGRSSWW